MSPRCRGMVRELLARVADLRSTVTAQQQRTDDLARRLYGRKSERVTDDAGAPADTPIPPSAATPDRPVRHRGHGRRPLPDHLTREQVEVDLAEAEKACPCCGKPQVRIRTEASEQLDYHPAYRDLRDGNCKGHAKLGGRRGTMS